VEDADIATAFASLCDTLAIEVRPADLMSRCAACNGDEYVATTADEVRAGGTPVSESVLRRLATFWRCTRCSKIFWEGGKFEESRGKFAALFEGEA